MTIIYLLITIIIGIMGIFSNIGVGELIGFASLLVTITIFYSNAINRQRKYNTEHELKIQSIYADLVELKARDKELEIKIKELDEKKMGVDMCGKMHQFNAEAIKEVKIELKELRSQITDNHNELLTKIK